MNLLTQIQWSQVGIVVGVIAGLALVLAACILVVSRLCKTEPDEKTDAILKSLAGANCGGCGCTGCSVFAEKLTRGEAELSDCHVTGEIGKREIAQILGVPYAQAQPTVAVCRCNGGNNAKNDFEYAGAQDCAAESLLHGGHKACKFGCVGKGSCVHSCPEEAIYMEELCARVEPDRCISCGKCISVCPKGLFMRIPQDAKVYIACSSHHRGKRVLDVCAVGCIACGKCARICPSNAIVMRDDLPEIDYEKCIKCGKCAEECPRHTILTRY